MTKFKVIEGGNQSNLITHSIQEISYMCNLFLDNEPYITEKEDLIYILELMLGVCQDNIKELRS